MRSYRLIVSVVLVCAAAVGCVRTHTEMLDTSTVVISSRGTAFDTPTTVVKATLVQAAQVAQEHGFQYFKVMSVDDTTRVSTLYTPPRTHTSGTVSGSVTGYGGFGQFDGSYEGTSYTTPGRVETFIHPGADVAIKMFHDGEVDPRLAGVWSVASVLTSAGIDSASPSGLAVRTIPADATQTLPAPQLSTSKMEDATSRSAPTEKPLQRFDEWQKSNRN